MWMWPSIKMREGPKILVSCFPGVLYDIVCMWSPKTAGVFHWDEPLQDFCADSYDAQYFLRAALKTGMLQPLSSSGLVIPRRSLH